DGERRRRLQPARVPQRHGLAARQLDRRLGPDAARALGRGAPHRQLPLPGRGALRLVAAGGVRRLLAHGHAVPDRLPDRRAATGLGGRRAGAAAAHPARPRARPQLVPPAQRPRGRRAQLGGGAAPDGGARLRPHVGRLSAARARPRGGGVTVRIALIAPVWFPMPPERYGGTERVVSLLADGLVEAGHDVTLFASGDSQTEAALDSVFETAPSERIGQTWWELQHAVHALGRAGEFDVVNDHTGLLGLALGGLVTVPFVHTVHGPLDGGPGEMYAEICRLVPRARLISISQSQRAPRPRLPWVATCHNALDLSLYPFRPGDRAARRRDYLVFLGRMSPDKGAHRAIAIARKADVPLKIAAKCRERAEQE